MAHGDIPHTGQLQDLVVWMRATPMHKFMVDNPIAFTAAETIHFMGLTALFGALLVIDLRGMGLLKRMPFSEAHKMVPWALGAFAAQLITGLMFIFTGPENYFFNHAFRWKVVFLLLAGINALVFEVFVFRPYKAGVPGIDGGAVVKVSSALSLLLWAGVLIMGRLIPYI